MKTHLRTPKPDGFIRSKVPYAPGYPGEGYSLCGHPVARYWDELPYGRAGVNSTSDIADVDCKVCLRTAKARGLC